MCRSSAKDNSQMVELVSYYGRVIDIILLDYNVFYVPIFRCQWAVRGNGVKVEDGFTLVNLNQSQVSFLKDPFILASQAKQVFYSREDDASSWYVVMRGSSRRYCKEDLQEGNADIGPLPADIDMDVDIEDYEIARTDCEGIYVQNVAFFCILIGSCIFTFAFLLMSAIHMCVKCLRLLSCSNYFCSFLQVN